MRLNLHQTVSEMLEQAEQNARQELGLDTPDREKTAAVADTEVTDDYVEKVASALEWLAGSFKEAAVLEQAALDDPEKTAGIMDWLRRVGGNESAALSHIMKNPDAQQELASLTQRGIGSTESLMSNEAIARNIRNARLQAGGAAAGLGAVGAGAGYAMRGKPEDKMALGSVLKQASEHRGPGGGQQFATSKAQGGTQNAATGQAKTQIQSHGLHGNPGMPGKANVQDTMGDTATLHQKQPQVSGTTKTAEREAIKQAILGSALLAKEAGMEYGPRANIEGRVMPLPEGVSAAGEGPHATGKGADLVSSIERVVALTKGQAKALVKPDLRMLLDEPPLSSATDPVLQNSFKHTGQAGVKIAGLGAALKGGTR